MVFDKHSPYLATKKIGKNNPKEEQIKTDNWARMEWNRTIDRALVEGISREEVLQIKREEITEKVQESVHRWGNRPWSFFSIVTHAVDVLAALIEKIQEQFQRIATLFEKARKDTAPVESIESVSMVETFVQETEKTSIQAGVDVITALQKPEPEEQMANLPQAILSSEIKENTVLTCEKELGQLRQDLLLCTGVSQGKRRKELQGQIIDKEQKLTDAKERLKDIVRGYGYPSVDSFMKIYRNTKTDYVDYTKRLKEWGDKYGMRYVKWELEENAPSSFHLDSPLKKR